MAFEVISTHVTSHYTVDAGDEVFITRDGILTSSTSGLYGLNDEIMRIAVDGTIATHNECNSLGLHGH